MENEEKTEEKNNKFRPIIIIMALIILVVIAGYFALTGNKSTQNQITPTTNQTTNTEISATEEADKISDENLDAMKNTTIVEVEGGGFYFDPNEIRAKAGDTIKIVFTNAGGTHDFVIDDLNVQSKLTQSGETAEVTFVAGEAGEYEYYCSVGNHRQMGMVGTLIVE